jgi:hypothetical protein
MTVETSIDLIVAGKQTRHLLPTLGTCSWWSITDIAVTRADLKDRFFTCDLPKDWLPDSRTAKSAFLRACGARAEKHLLVRKLEDNNEECVFAFVDETIERTNPRYAVRTKARLDKITEEVVIENDLNGFGDTLLTDYVRFLNEYNAADVQQLLLSIIHWRLNGVGIRPNGGIYFTPKDTDPTIDKLVAFVEEFGNGSVLFTMGIVDAERTRLNLFQIMKAELEGELSRYAEELDGFLAPDAPTRPSTLARKLEQFQKAEAKAEMYESLLEMEAADLHDRIAGLRQRVALAMANGL